MNVSLTNRIECHHGSGSPAGLAESGDVHGVHPELVLQALDQAGHLVVALQAGQLVLPHPQDGVSLLLLNPVASHLAAAVVIWHLPFDADDAGGHGCHIWTTWRTWSNCGAEVEVSSSREHLEM